jgi:PPOX class probable F420-dependent enzyme
VAALWLWKSLKLEDSRRSPTRVAFSAAPDLNSPYNIPMPIPRELQGQNYVSLMTFRKSGVAVPTPIWFGEDDNKIYVMTRSDSGKYKRIRNKPQVRVAPCSIRGKITGPEFEGRARILPAEDWPRARKTIQRKYWLARIPFVWSKQNVYIEIDGFTSHS